MKEIGIRELKAHASALVNKVAESHATYVITKHGQTIGMLTPADHLIVSSNKNDDVSWNRLFQLAKEIDTKSTSRKSAVREVSTMRR